MESKSAKKLEYEHYLDEELILRLRDGDSAITDFIMDKYKNLSGQSNVSSYEIGDDYIDVIFMDGCVYGYTYSSAGHQNIEAMKSLAREGLGLNSFINTYVRKLYAYKR